MNASVNTRSSTPFISDDFFSFLLSNSFSACPLSRERKSPKSLESTQLTIPHPNFMMIQVHEAWPYMLYWYFSAVNRSGINKKDRVELSKTVFLHTVPSYSSNRATQRGFCSISFLTIISIRLNALIDFYIHLIRCRRSHSNGKRHGTLFL